MKQSRKRILNCGNGLMMDKNVTLVRTIYKRVPAPQNQRSYGSPGAMTSISSMSCLGTLGKTHHYQSLRGKQLENPTRQPETLGHQGTSAFGKNRRHHCLTKNACAIIFSQTKHGPSPERLRLPYSDEEILSGYEEDISFTRDGFTAWVKQTL